KQNAAERVADGGAEAAFKRFDDELAVSVGLNALVRFDPGGKFKSAPTNTHGDTSESVSSRIIARKSIWSRGREKVSSFKFRVSRSDEFLSGNSTLETQNFVTRAVSSAGGSRCAAAGCCLRLR